MEKTMETTYSSLVITSGGGVGFEDKTLKGLLAQTKEWVSSCPVGRGDYTAEDRWHNRFVLWAIQANRPSFIDDAGNHYYHPTIH
jgi:hypothetical protein